jgi:hypothetical protein
MADNRTQGGLQMKVRTMSRVVTPALAGMAAMLFSVSAAHALDKYTTTLNAVRGRDAGDVKLKVKLTLKMKASTTDGVGGMTIQIAGSGIDCPGNNDLGVAYKCGPVGVRDPDHVLALNTEFGGEIVMQVIGLRFSVEKGKPVLDTALGKNKIDAIDTVFGPLVSFTYGAPLGLGFLKIHEPGSDPADCDNVLLGDPQGCLDGDVYAFEGLHGGSDCLNPCTLNLTCWIASNASECSDDPSDEIDCAVCHTEACPGGLATECARNALGVGCRSDTDMCCDANVTACPCANNADCGTGFTCNSGVCS